MGRMLNLTRSFFLAEGHASRDLLRGAEVEVETDGGGGTGLKALCALLYVHDCTQEMDGKEMRHGACALSPFSSITKELSDGLAMI